MSRQNGSGNPKAKTFHSPPHKSPGLVKKLPRLIEEEADYDGLLVSHFAEDFNSDDEKEGGELDLSVLSLDVNAGKVVSDKSSPAKNSFHARLKQAANDYSDSESDSEDLSVLKKIKLLPALSDDPLSITRTIFVGGTPIQETIHRLASDDLSAYFSQVAFVPSPLQADLNRSKIIFVGTDHRTSAFFELIKSLKLSGKNIRAVFMEELNADQIALDSEQNIVDRHFVANTEEYAKLNIAHNISDLDLDKMVSHLHCELENYMDGNCPTHEYFRDFLRFLAENAIQLGGIDTSRYRERPTDGYNYHRHTQMNYFAAKVISSYVQKNPDFCTDDSIIVVSYGNTHGINNQFSIPQDDGGKIGVRGIPDLVNIELGPRPVPLTSISMLVNNFAANQLVSLPRSSALPESIVRYDTNTPIAISAEESVRFSSKYLMAAHDNDDLVSQVGNLVAVINPPGLSR